MTNDPNIFGDDLFGEAIKQDERGEVANKFLASPFTVLDARQGWWQDRKRGWIALGIRSEEGRPGATCMPPGGKNLSQHYKDKEAAKNNAGLIFPKGCSMDFYRDKKVSAEPPPSGGILFPPSSSLQFYNEKRKLEAELGRELTTAEFTEIYTPQCAADSGTSIFDPVLCECAYLWWCPAGGQVIDPFAGGSVRGIVAKKLGLEYWGSELRQEQVDSNVKQGEDICGFDGPIWWCGDAANATPPEGDMIIGCPPYADLEVYSDLPEDLSNMTYEAFREAYFAIIRRFCAALKKNRFAVWVVGEIRDPKTGIYRNFVGDTIAAFQEAGLLYYNEAIVVTMVGSASLRVTRQFEAGRKLCKTHQNLLVFVKGDPKVAAEACRKIQPNQTK